MTMFFKTEGRLKFDYDDSPELDTPEVTVATSARWSPKQSVQNINPGVEEQQLCTNFEQSLHFHFPYFVLQVTSLPWMNFVCVRTMMSV